MITDPPQNARRRRIHSGQAAILGNRDKPGYDDLKLTGRSTAKTKVRSPDMAKQKPEFEIYVEGEPYLWRLQRQPQWSSDTNGWQGKALAVRHREALREVVIEFPPERQPRYGAPQLQPSQIPVELVARAIASALAAGWEPFSRGKTVTIVVDADGQ